MADLEIVKVTIENLEDHFSSIMKKGWKTIPITPERVLSFVNNPNALPSDISLYYIESEGQQIAFLTLWGDKVRIGSKEIHFGWASSSWVDAKFRRKGISIRLLREAYKDWDGKLMFTNYAPETVYGYIKTGLFPYSISRVGRRFYFNANLLELYANRIDSRQIKIAVKILNAIFRTLYFLKKKLFFPHRLTLSSIENTLPPEDNLCNFSHSLFCRDKKTFEWIFNFPWLAKSTIPSFDFPFSWHTNLFNYKWVTIAVTEQSSASYLVSNREGVVKLLYWKATDNKQQLLIAKSVANFCFENKIKTLTVIDPILANYINEVRSPFVFSKKYEMNIYSTFDIGFDNFIVFDGDGDNIFT